MARVETTFGADSSAVRDPNHAPSGRDPAATPQSPVGPSDERKGGPRIEILQTAAGGTETSSGSNAGRSSRAVDHDREHAKNRHNWVSVQQASPPPTTGIGSNIAELAAKALETAGVPESQDLPEPETAGHTAAHFAVAIPKSDDEGQVQAGQGSVGTKPAEQSKRQSRGMNTTTSESLNQRKRSATSRAVPPTIEDTAGETSSTGKSTGRAKLPRVAESNKPQSGSGVDGLPRSGSKSQTTSLDNTGETTETEGLNDAANAGFRLGALQAEIQTRLVVYSDGSKTEQDTAGFGYAVYRRQQLIAQGCGQIGRSEVFDAEIKGAVEGLRAALAHQRPKEGITVCIDNTSVIDCIGTTAPPSSQMAFRMFQKTGDAHPGMIRVRWCPGHTGIEGNELADQLAKESAKMPVGDNLPTVSYCRRHMRSLLAIAFQRWWDKIDRETYRGLQLKAELKKLPELTLQRRQLGYLLAARTHHGDFADYHERFNHEDAELNYPCGRRKSPTHLFYYKRIPRSLRPRLAPEPEAAIRRYLGRSFQTYLLTSIIRRSTNDTKEQKAPSTGD
ncbi:reverse transcriptase [Beauveria bassiana ARSEF 2860]|uniref:ribonuclease H n=1 Tax=Beauveria bassiana (strain ARSEF 2860) TaxID=655819 RepID=J5JJK3_BEAB2|nr:reverse transcriptase [Beauveria bassiana ARSEF 2860]EJP63491.1 reverse transcriptase [Beauveria bassiana ARSEF 2860]